VSTVDGPRLPPHAGDAATVLLAAGGGALTLLIAQASPHARAGTMLVVDVALGVAACVALLLRRRWPLGLALALALPAALSAAAAIAGLAGVFAAAARRRAGLVLPVVAVHVVASAVSITLWPSAEDSEREQVLWTAAFYATVLAWGMLARARRQLVGSLRERAERAEAEQRLLAEQARHAERTRIAREMHDILAHRVSLVALHAGGLELRPDLPPDEVRRTAGVIRTSARQALEELRDVIGMLREEPAPHAPTPALRDIPQLVEQSRCAGSAVQLRMHVDEPDTAPGSLGRAAYRIVQEALTNVHKHAAGSPATVSLRGGPGEGLQVDVRNPLPRATATALPGAGSGLVGLAERVALAGGTLSHGPSAEGQFVVAARLRWAR